MKASEEEICPIDGKTSKYIVDNIALGEQIGELYIHCKYGCKERVPATVTANAIYEVDSTGCPVTMKMSERFPHEADCQYAPVLCPNNPDCPQIRLKVRDPNAVLVGG